MFGLRMLAVKKSMNRSAAASPRSAIIAGTTSCGRGRRRDDGECPRRVLGSSSDRLGIGQWAPSPWSR